MGDLKLESTLGSVTITPEDIAQNSTLTLPNVTGILLTRETMSHKASFEDSNLITGVLQVPHSLGTKYPSAVAVWDNNDEIVSPDKVTGVDTGNVTVDLSSYGTITGTWNISIIY